MNPDRPAEATTSPPSHAAAVLLCGLLLTGAAAGAAEPAYQPHRDIEAAVQNLIGERLRADYPRHRVEVGALDPRLRLRRCDRPLQGFLPPGSRLPGNTTVGVRCDGAAPWTIYVPAAASVSAEVVVLKRSVPRGTAITAADVGVVLRELNSPEAAIRDPAEVIGKLARRPLAADAIVTAAMLTAPLLVRRGQQVVIVANVPGIDVRMQGVALGAGAAGDRIRVRNLVSQRVVEATVIEAGVAQVTL